MSLDQLLSTITSASQDLLAAIQANRAPDRLGLRRSARLPILAVLYTNLARPILLLTDRTDHALTLIDELSLWLPDAPRLIFPEPTPLFYENAPWGLNTRRDRLSVLSLFADYHIPGSKPPPYHR
jgi:hypothetical protein